jgi:galactose mutarotase-like enzyme
MTHEQGRPVDTWHLLTGGSVAIVAGLGADLLRLGVHEARRLLGARGVSHDWHPPSTCRACNR